MRGDTPLGLELCGYISVKTVSTLYVNLYSRHVYFQVDDILVSSNIFLIFMSADISCI